MTNHTLFISDLHLSADFPTSCARFFTFIENQAVKADALYILGDFFDKWIGDDNLSTFNLAIMKRLRSLSNQHIPIYLLHGNHDFLLGKKFSEVTGVTIINDPTVINLYGKATLLTHGDILCSLDKKHQRYRKVYTNRILQRLFLFIPLRYRRQIANRLRHHSIDRTKHLAENIMDVTVNAVENAMQNSKTNLMIHGHTHRPAIHQHTVQYQPATRIVLDSWHQHGNYLIYHHDGRFQLRNFT